MTLDDFYRAVVIGPLTPDDARTITILSARERDHVITPLEQVELDALRAKALT
jgi:hypothetical protein